MKNLMNDELGAPRLGDRSTFQAELDALRAREKAHIREGDAIAAARRESVGNFVFVSHTKGPERAGGSYGNEQGRWDRG